MFRRHLCFIFWWLCPIFFALFACFLVLFMFYILSLCKTDTIYTHSMACCFAQIIVCFVCRDSFHIVRSHLVVVGLKVSCIGDWLGKSCANEFKCILYFLICLRVFDLHWYPWSMWRWILCRVVDMDIFSFFYMQLFSLKGTICWICCIFTSVYFGLLCQKSGVQKYMKIGLNIKIYSVDH